MIISFVIFFWKFIPLWLGENGKKIQQVRKREKGVERG